MYSAGHIYIYIETIDPLTRLGWLAPGRQLVYVMHMPNFATLSDIFSTS